MRILRLEKSERPKGIVLRSFVAESEFEQLRGQLDHLCIFAARLLDQRASVIKTGARHSFAKYLLCPVSLRRHYKTSSYDFGAVACGAIEDRDKLYIIYGIPRAASPSSPETPATIAAPAFTCVGPTGQASTRSNG